MKIPTHVIAIAAAVLGCLPALGQVVVVPGDHREPPPMPDILPQGGSGLNNNEDAAAEAMVREFENYAAQKNDPALLERAALMRAARNARRLGRGNGPGHRGARTLPDWARYDTGGSPTRHGWLPPGFPGQVLPGAGGGGGGGGRRPSPNWIVFSDGYLEGPGGGPGSGKVDPRPKPGGEAVFDCLRRAMAIIFMTQEGGRAKQSGVMDGGVEPDCNLLKGAIQAAAKTRDVLNDLANNGVPANPGTGQGACNFNGGGQSAKQIKNALAAQAADAAAQVKRLCDIARKKNCPLPPECG